jgi:segregation and condensation protein A
VDEIQIPEGATFRIQLGAFEGPLDLLLHLIKKHELDILDLPIAFVTERYLDYLQMMQELDLDVASEYLLMAATLAHIKSKMLLPQNPLDEVEEQDEGYVADPRAELIRRLLEYQKYRAAAEQLGARPIAGRDVFGRGLRTEEAQGPAPLAPIDLYKLLDAFGAILKRVKGRVALEVTAEQITIGERISQLSEVLRTKRSCVFDELFAKDRTRYEVIVTFLALLEMTKLRITRVYQSDPAAPLHIQYALLDAEAAMPSEEDLAAAFASTPVDLREAASGESEAPAFQADGELAGETEREGEGEGAKAEELLADDFVESEPLTSGESFAESLEEQVLESDEAEREGAAEVELDADPSELQSEAPADETSETAGLDYDALQPDLSPVDAMAGIFAQIDEVATPELDAALAPESLESAPDALEAAPDSESALSTDRVEAAQEPEQQPEPETKPTEPSDEDPASDPETPV